MIKGNDTFLDHWTSIEKNYAVLNSGDILVSNNDFVQLVRPDFYWYRYRDHENFSEVVTRMCAEGKPVFTDLGDRIGALDRPVSFVEGYDYPYSRSRTKLLARIECGP